MKAKLSRVRRLCELLGLATLAIVALSTTLFAGPQKGADMKVDATVEVPSIIAVRIRHDMCPLCKQLDPQFPKLIVRTSAESVLFVTLDLTSQTMQKQAALLVGALGIEHVWTGDLSKIGSVTFVDGKSKRLISSVQTVDVKAIETALQDAVDSSRAKP